MRPGTGLASRIMLKDKCSCIVFPNLGLSLPFGSKHQ
jgi:hypothetical protein